MIDNLSVEVRNHCNGEWNGWRMILQLPTDLGALGMDDNC